MAAGKHTAPNKEAEIEKVSEYIPKAGNGRQASDMEKETGSFIYIGPATRTGLVENAVFYGTRKSVEEYLKGTLDKIPQAAKLIVETKSLAAGKEKVRTTGTLLNKYYNDILSMSEKYEEG